MVRPANESPLNALTIDVEDYYQVSAFERFVDRRTWDNYESRVVVNTHRILRLLERRAIHGTFFVLGWVAHRFPQLVRDIHRAGHELASHSYWHRLVYNLTPEEFLSDLRQSCAAISDVTGEPVRAYRAPSFSITKQSLWALDLLAAEGFHYDSSVFAVHHDRYGIPDAHPWLHQLPTAHGPLWEFPASVVRLGKINLPVAGGGYFRLYPLRLTTRFLDHVNTRARQPFMFYLHPWEVDPEQPRLKVGSAKSRMRHYLNLASTESKFTELLGRFRFGAMRDVISQRAAFESTAAAHPAMPGVAASPVGAG